jgi:hypothetical protein
MSDRSTKHTEGGKTDGNKEKQDVLGRGNLSDGF